MYRLPLFDHRVLDLVGGEGAYAGRLLGELGAEVIKVEPSGGDPLRRLDAKAFERLNLNKYGCVIDVRSGEGGEALARLADLSDVIIAASSDVNFSRLMKANRQLIAVHLPDSVGITMAVAAVGAVGVALWDRRRTGRGGEITMAGPGSGRIGTSANGVRTEMVSTVRGNIEIPASPWALSETPLHVRLPAPGLGEHDGYVHGTLLGSRGP
jgi:crotonobetainyl-CoA:carnitine CoA-transferase CaiB-like acyl-CoA transferase